MPDARSNPAPLLSTEGEPSAIDPAVGPSSPPPSPDLSDPATADRWLEAIRESLLDLLAVAREGARRPRKRVLSRSEMRRQARDAFAQMTSLLDVAAAALRKAG